MSLYKTQRCRHFDEAGNAVKPYCTQGNKCRFIHPNDHQWTKLKRRNDDSPTPENRDSIRSKGKNKPQLSPGSPFQHQRSSPLMPQTDLFKRKQKDNPREYDHRDRPVWNGDRRRDSDSWGYTRERNGPYDQGYSLKRANEESDSYPNQRPRLSERALFGPAPGGDTRRATQTNKIPCPSTNDPKTKTKVDTFHRLAKLCCEIVQDTCFLDREEDKLKAFTGLSSELSRTGPDAAMAVTPALATVINGHSRTRERLESHIQELEALWKTLFSVLEGDISKAINSHLERAMTILGNERDNALQVIARSQRFAGDRPSNGTTGPRQSDQSRETGTDKTTTLSERSMTSVNGAPAVNLSPQETRHSGGPTPLSAVQTQETDLGTSLRIVLEDMKMQMDRQTRAIELLAKENQQLRSASECHPPQLVPSDDSSSSRKPSVL